MRQLLSFCAEFAAAPLLLVPLFLILNRIRFHSGKRTALYTLLAVYLAGVYTVAGLPSVIYLRFEPNFNFIPFAGMSDSPSDAILNVALFVPLGFFLAVLWKPFRNWKKALLFGFCTSLASEVLQMFTFRATDVNDLITNTLGAVLGWLLAHFAVKLCPRLNLDNNSNDLPVVFGAVFCTMFFVYPFLYPLTWKLLH